MKKQIFSLFLAVLLLLSMCACGSEAADSAAVSGGNEADTAVSAGSTAEAGESFTLRVGMDCAYAPYCWTQDDDSNGAVPIADSNE